VVVLINCGATESIRELCSLSDNVRVIIIDSHRPVYHKYTEEHNFREPGGVFVVVDDDDPVPKGHMPGYRSDLEDEQASEGEHCRHDRRCGPHP
jgi:cell division control protein 45